MITIASLKLKKTCIYIVKTLQIVEDFKKNMWMTVKKKMEDFLEKVLDFYCFQK